VAAVTHLFGAPAVAASGDGRLELFAFTIDGGLWHIGQTAWSNGWSGWSSQGAGGSWPAAIAPSGDGRLEVFVAGAGLGHASQTAWSNGWSALTSLGSPPPSPEQGFFAPGIAPNADGRLEVFVANGQLWRLEQTAWSSSNGWSGWLPHGAPPGRFVIGPPTAGRTGDGRAEVFVVDNARALWNIRQTAVNGPWSDWNSFGSAGSGLDDRPSLARNADGRLTVFARSTDGTLWSRTQIQVSPADEWSDWVPEGTAGGGFFDHPVVGSSADGRLELFLTGRDGNIWHKWQTAASNGWSGWVSEGSAGGGFTNAAPELGRNGDGRLELFAVAVDGNLWHKWQTAASNGWSGWASLGQPGTAATTTVPDVFGLPRAAAAAEVNAAHLHPSFTGTSSQPSWVQTQSPAAGRTVAQDSTVTMHLVPGLPP
jgi:PASTA domain-containing protein